jgi:hypothetical protein
MHNFYLDALSYWHQVVTEYQGSWMSQQAAAETIQCLKRYLAVLRTATVL